MNGEAKLIKSILWQRLAGLLFDDRREEFEIRGGASRDHG